MSSGSRWIGIGAIVVSLTFAAATNSEVMYDSFGPGGMATGEGLLVYPPGLGDPFDIDAEMAAAFSFSTGSFLLQSIALPLWAGHGGSNDVVVSIYADAGGSPGELIESVNLFDQVPSFPFPPGPAGFPHGQATATAMFSGGSMLAAGQTYWVGVEETAPGVITWITTDDIQPGDVALSLSGTDDWETVSGLGLLAMTVHGAAIPAPPAAALLGLAMRARRRRS